MTIKTQCLLSLLAVIMSADVAYLIIGQVIEPLINSVPIFILVYFSYIVGYSCGKVAENTIKIIFEKNPFWLWL